MDITWLDSELPGASLRKDRSLVGSWLKEHREEVHGLCHLVEEMEIEAVRILSGEQETDEEGRVTLRTLEVHFMKGIVLVERVVEVQLPGSYSREITSTQLGYLEPLPCSDECCGPPPKKK